MDKNQKEIDTGKCLEFYRKNILFSVMINFVTKS